MANLTDEQTQKCLDIMRDALDLLGFARPNLTMDQKLEVISRCYRHPAAGDTGEELGEFADSMFGAPPEEEEE